MTEGHVHGVCGSVKAAPPPWLRRHAARRVLTAEKSSYMRALNERPSPSPPIAVASDRPVSADRGALVTTVIRLWPYIWPSDRADLKLRVLGAMVLLLIAKFATLAVPFTFKWAVDALAGGGSAPVAASDWLLWALAAPVVMTIAYGGMRILMAALTQLRDGLFAKVAMHAVRRLAYRTFVHMHELSLRFHLERKTGGLDARAGARRATPSRPSCAW